MLSQRRRSIALGVVAAALVLAACGGGGDDAIEVIPSTPADAEDSNAAPATDAPATGPVELVGLQVDLVGEDVLPSAEIESNLLPAVVLDDVTTGRKVNFRNLVPQDRPVLLWMWAPY